MTWPRPGCAPAGRPVASAASLQNWPGSLISAVGQGCEGGACSPAHPGPGPRRNTHLEHDFIDGSGVRFEVEVFIVVIA